MRQAFLKIDPGPVHLGNQLSLFSVAKAAHHLDPVLDGLHGLLELLQAGICLLHVVFGHVTRESLHVDDIVPVLVRRSSGQLEKKLILFESEARGVGFFEGKQRLVHDFAGWSNVSQLFLSILFTRYC